MLDVQNTALSKITSHSVLKCGSYSRCISSLFRALAFFMDSSPKGRAVAFTTHQHFHYADPTAYIIAENPCTCKYSTML